MGRRRTSLTNLLARGDIVRIEDGCLQICPKSGQPVPKDWIKTRESELIAQILEVTGKKGFRFLRHTTGNYTKHLAGGVTLHFLDCVTGESPCVTFNANLKRDRKSKYGKKGDPLPAGRFKVGPGSKFIQFWKRAGLALPIRLSSFHECMGKLKGIVFQASYRSRNQLLKDSLTPLTVTYQEILKASGIAIFPDMHRSNILLGANNLPTRCADKELAHSERKQGIPADSGACADHSGQRTKGDADNAIPIPPSPSNSAREQSNAEWLRDYDTK